jgi:hypothetical protein
MPFTIVKIFVTESQTQVCVEGGDRVSGFEPSADVVHAGLIDL